MYNRPVATYLHYLLLPPSLMPLINGERFYKTRPSSLLQPDDEVFFCPVTLEIFSDYDEYFERTILVNSTAWHCAMCGRGPITYTEAVQCESTDSRQLNTYDSSLAAGLLHIIESVKCRRLPDLVELLCNFASNRFFIGELVEFPLNKARHPGIVRQVLLSAGRTVPSVGAGSGDGNWNNPGGLPAANQVIYCITDNRRTDSSTPSKRSGIHPTGPLFFPAAALQRRGGSCLTRDRTRYFIRHTCELANGCFVPKASILQRYGLFPHGPLTWRDLYLLPEPNWLELISYYNSLNASVTRPIIKSVMRSAAQLTAAITAARGASTVPNPGAISRVPTSTLGRKQLFPKPCNSNDSAESEGRSTVHATSESWLSEANANATQEQMERTQRSLIERDWLCIRRREDMELSDLIPLPDLTSFPTRLPSTAIGSALQVLEFFHVFGRKLELHIPKPHQPGSKDPLLSWMVLEQALVEADPCGPLADLFMSLLLAIRRLDSDFSTKRATLNIPPATYSAANAVAAAEVGAPFNLPVTSSGSSSDSSGLFDDLLLAPGGVSSKTLKLLRSAGSAARLNELVGIPYLFLWTGACRSAQTLQQQLTDASNAARKEDPGPVAVGPSRMGYSRAVSLATLNGATALCPLDRLGLSCVLQLYLATSAARGGCWRGQTRFCMRPLDDPAFMACREHGQLLDKLNSVSVYELTVEEKLILLNCLVDQLLLHPIIRDQVDDRAERLRILRIRLRQSKSEQVTAKLVTTPQMVEESNPTSSALPGQDSSSNTTGAIVESTTSVPDRPARGRPPTAGRNNALDGQDDGTSGTTADVNASSADGHCVSSNVPAESNGLLKDKMQLLDELIEASRGSAMIPLGQDRYCRRYWLLLSLPGVLVEDAPSSAEHPLAISPILLSRQISAFHPDVADAMALSSTRLATVKLREFVAKHPNMHREAITHHLCSRLPNQPLDRVLTTQQLKMLVYPERVTEHDLPIQTRSPAVTQTHQIRLAHQSAPKGTSIWSILTPSTGPIPPAASIKSDPECGEVVNKPIDLTDCSSTSSSTSEPSLDERATWTIDCLEATLNPRGVRESRLRRVIGELRPLLIRVVAQCPPDLMRTPQHPAQNTCNNVTAYPVEAIPGFWSRSSTAADQGSTDSVLLNWLELSLRRMATRLGLRELMRDCITSAVDCKEMNKSIEQVSSDETSQCKTKSPAQMLVCNSPPKPPSRLQQLARALLLFGQAIGPKALLGPLGHDSRTMRIVPASDPGVSLTSSPVVPNLAGIRSSDSLYPDGPSALWSSHYTTTGWERWCAHVARAQSASHVHLLARSLERGVRRMLLFGNSLRLNIPAFQRGGYLPPKLRCTACLLPPDSSSQNIASGSQLVQAQPAAVTNSRGTHIPFCVCAGCGAPFHLDCLLHSRSRSRRAAGLRRPPDKFNHRILHSRVLQSRGLTAADILNTVGYTGLQSPLANQGAMRAETVVGSLFLCRTCLRVAGQTLPTLPGVAESDSDTEGSHEFTGDEEWAQLSDDSDDRLSVPSDAVSGSPQASDSGESNANTLTERKCKRAARAHSHEIVEALNQSDLESSDIVDGFKSKRTKLESPSSRTIKTHRGRGALRAGRLTAHRRMFSDRRRIRSSSPDSKASSTSQPSSVSVKPKRGRPSKLDRESIPEPDSDSDSLKDIIVKFPMIKRVSIVLNPCDLTTSITNNTAIRGSMARRGRPISRRCSAPQSRTRPYRKTTTEVAEISGSLPSPMSPSCATGTELTQPAIERLFADLCDSPVARPLLRCGIGRPHQGVLTEHNVSDSSDGSCTSAVVQPSPRKSLPLRTRRRPARLDPEPVRRQLCAWDLSSLRELVARGKIPGGPETAVHQLRLLIKHWLLTNRPGSRIHESALAVSALLNRKMVDLGQSVEQKHSLEIE